MSAKTLEAIRFGGPSPASAAPRPRSLSKKFIPLDEMSGVEKRQAFGLWLGIVYFNRRKARKDPRWGIAAEEDPMLVLDFTTSYEKGDWKLLGRGFTVEEMVFHCEFGTGEPIMCLVNRDGPKQPLRRVRRKRVMQARQLVSEATLYFMLKQGQRRHGIIAMVYDGEMGHCISLLDGDHEQGLFAYHDPWPGRSLLCEENNKAGVRAISLGRQQLGSSLHERWSMTAKELESVVVALLVRPDDWELISGEVLEID